MGICEISSDRKDQILALAAGYGVARSDNPKQEEKALQAILDNFGVLEFDDKAAPLFGRITAYLQQIGRPAGDMDVLIAATAIANGHNLITRNRRHFMNIPHC